MGRTLKISEARKRLFDLVDEVTSEPDEVILIEHRDRPERVALVSERYLRYLRATIAALRTERADFRLGGSMTLAVEEEDVELAIADSRAEQSVMARRKLRDL